MDILLLPVFQNRLCLAAQVGLLTVDKLLLNTFDLK